MPDITVDLSQLETVVGQAFQRIEASMSAQALEKAVMAGAKIVRDAAKENAPTVTGTLKSSIGAALVESSQSHAVAQVKPGKKGWYWRFLEFGTAVRKVRKKKVMYGKGKFYGKEVRGVRARPFLGPALEQNEPRVVDAIQKSLRDTLLGAVR